MIHIGGTRLLSLGALIGTDVLLCRMQERFAWLLLCNERLLATNSLCNSGGSKCTKVRGGPTDGSSAYIAGLPHIGVRDAANCYALDPSTRVGRAWRQVDGHLEGECRRDGPCSYFGVLPHHQEQRVTKRRTQDCGGQGGRVMRLCVSCIFNSSRRNTRRP